MSTNFATQLDHSLISAAKRGRSAAQRVIFETYKTPVYRLIRGLTRDPELAQDLSQDAFIQAFQKLPQLQDHNALGSWLKQLSVNLTLAHLRKPQRLVAVDSAALEHEELPQPSQAAAERLSELDDLEKYLELLQPEEQQIVWLYLVEDFNHNEIAELYQIPAATIRQRYHRALKKLQQGVLKYVE